MDDGLLRPEQVHVAYYYIIMYSCVWWWFANWLNVAVIMLIVYVPKVSVIDVLPTQH